MSSSQNTNYCNYKNNHQLTSYWYCYRWTFALLTLQDLWCHESDWAELLEQYICLHYSSLACSWHRLHGCCSRLSLFPSFSATRATQSMERGASPRCMSARLDAVIYGYIIAFGQVLCSIYLLPVLLAS